MSITIELTPEEELRLEQIARERGQSLEAFVMERLRPELRANAVEVGDADIPELWRGLVGSLHSGNGRLSENTGKQFTEGLVEKYRAGHI